MTDFSDLSSVSTEAGGLYSYWRNLYMVKYFTTNQKVFYFEMYTLQPIIRGFVSFSIETIILKFQTTKQ